jgi:hypothetical protein
MKQTTAFCMSLQSGALIAMLVSSALLVAAGEVSKNAALHSASVPSVERLARK